MATKIPKTIAILCGPESYYIHIAQAKNTNSNSNRRKPEVAITVFPDRLGSSGTAKIPQTAAVKTTIKTVPIIRQFPVNRVQFQLPKEYRAANSNRKRNARFKGWVPILVHLDDSVIIPISLS